MEEMNKAVVFQLGQEEYAVPIEFVTSIEKPHGIKLLPHLPNHIKGIVKVRDELVPVIDLENMLYHRDIDADDLTKIIVLHTEVLSAAILVSDAKEIIDIPNKDIKQVRLIANQKTAYLSGIAALGSRLITMINPSALVRSLDELEEIQEFITKEAETISNE